jgi:hypothetical protein
MPEWAEGARIVYDTQYPLAFIRRGARGGTWTPYTVTQKGNLRLLGTASRKKLDDTRHSVLEALGESVQAMVMALHPGARYSHFALGYSKHACGAPYAEFKTVYALLEVTCPVCLAVLEEQTKKRAIEAGADMMEAARERVRTVDTLNALGQIVTDGKEKVQY